MSFQAVVPDKERLVLWAEALESGEFEQCQGRNLHIDTDELTGEEKRSYCCLGVANEIAWRNGVPCPDGDDEGADMDTDVRDWYGLQQSNPNLAPSHDPHSPDFNAIHLNDGERWTFTQIASAIRQRFGLPERSQLG